MTAETPHACANFMFQKCVGPKICLVLKYKPELNHNSTQTQPSITLVNDFADHPTPQKLNVSNVGSLEILEQIPTVTVTFVHIRNISAVTNQILMKPKFFWTENLLRHKFFQIFLSWTTFFWAKIYCTFFLNPIFFGPMIFGPKNLVTEGSHECH